MTLGRDAWKTVGKAVAVHGVTVAFILLLPRHCRRHVPVTLEAMLHLQCITPCLSIWAVQSGLCTRCS